MENNILIVNSSREKNGLLEDLLDELTARHYNFFLWSTNSDLLQEYRQKNRIATSFLIGPRIYSRLSRLVFFITLPWLMVYSSLRLIYWRYKYNLKAIILFRVNEKIILSRIAKILHLKVIWLELPDDDYFFLSGLALFLYKRLSRLAKLIIFTGTSKIKLVSLGIAESNITQVSLAIKLNQAKRQDNIFSNIAKAERGNLNRRYFTVGAVAQYDNPNQIETLFRALQSCRSIIPNLQLVILGEGEAKKRLIWAAKKLEVENIVWFVGRQDNLRKWLEGFDVYAVVNEAPSPVAIKVLLKAMETGLPILGFHGHGWGDFITHEETGLLNEPGDSETLSSHLIKYYKNRLYMRRLGQNGKKLVANKFDLAQQIKEFENLL